MCVFHIFPGLASLNVPLIAPSSEYGDSIPLYDDIDYDYDVSGPLIEGPPVVNISTQSVVFDHTRISIINTTDFKQLNSTIPDDVFGQYTYVRD